MQVHPYLIQQSEAWFRVRKGRITASQADRILTPTGKDSSAWESFAWELIGETIRPDEMPRFSGNQDTDRGNELEAEAREAFQAETGLELFLCGFVSAPCGVLGFSPDALVVKPGVNVERDAVKSADGIILNALDLFIAGVELKCPRSANQTGWSIGQTLPKDHRGQVHFSIAVSGLPWYFASYCPGFARPFIVLQEADEFTAKMKDAAERFKAFYQTLWHEWFPKLTGRQASNLAAAKPAAQAPAWDDGEGGIL